MSDNFPEYVYGDPESGPTVTHNTRCAEPAPVAETEYEYRYSFNGSHPYDVPNREWGEALVHKHGGVLHRRPVGEWEQVPDDE